MDDKNNLDRSSAQIKKLTSSRIRRSGKDWCVFSANGEKNLGCGPSKEWAEFRLKNIELVSEIYKALAVKNSSALTGAEVANAITNRRAS